RRSASSEHLEGRRRERAQVPQVCGENPCGRPIMTGSASPMNHVYDGRDCVGFIVARGKLGVEAFDRAESSLGFFKTLGEAANAVVDGLLKKHGEAWAPPPIWSASEWAPTVPPIVSGHAVAIFAPSTPPTI